MTVVQCHCCGASIAGATSIDALCRELPPVLSLVVRVMAERPRARLDAGSIARIVYASTPDGGPTNGADAIRCAIRRGRHLLPSFGWQIGSGGRGDRRGYFLKVSDREVEERSSAPQHGASS